MIILVFLYCFCYYFYLKLVLGKGFFLERGKEGTRPDGRMMMMMMVVTVPPHVSCVCVDLVSGFMGIKNKKGVPVGRFPDGMLIPITQTRSLTY